MATRKEFDVGNGRAKGVTYLLLNLDVSLLKSDGLPATPGPYGSLALSGPFWVRGRVCPLWKVLRAFIFLGPNLDGGDCMLECGFALLKNEYNR